MKKILSVFVIISVICTLAFGFITTFSNLYSGYPSFLGKVTEPFKPIIKNSYYIEKYRRDVNQYIEDANNYIQAANNDINKIQQEINNARNAANNVVNKYNNFVSYGF